MRIPPHNVTSHRTVVDAEFDEEFGRLEPEFDGATPVRGDGVDESPQLRDATEPFKKLGRNVGERRDGADGLARERGSLRE